MTHTLSVITVTKDDLAGLEATSTSLARCHQLDLQKIEWIIVDSSSDFRSVQGLALKSGLDPTVRWIPANGIYDAMNEGLAVAQGSYAYFLNGGDRLREANTLGLLLDILDTIQPLWMYGQVAFSQPEKGTITPVPFDYRVEEAAYFARGRFPPHQGTVVSRKALSNLGGFDTTYRVCADYKAMLQLSQLDRPYEARQVIAEFSTDGVSQTKWLVSIREFHRARREVLSLQGVSAVREWASTIYHAMLLTLNRLTKQPR